MQDGIDAGADHGEQSHRFRDAIDRGPPLGPHQKEKRRHERAARSDRDPPDVSQNGKTPHHRPIVSPHQYRGKKPNLHPECRSAAAVRTGKARATTIPTPPRRNGNALDLYQSSNRLIYADRRHPPGMPLMTPPSHHDYKSAPSYVTLGLVFVFWSSKQRVTQGTLLPFRNLGGRIVDVAEGERLGWTGRLTRRRRPPRTPSRSCAIRASAICCTQKVHFSIIPRPRTDHIRIAGNRRAMFLLPPPCAKN